MLLTLEITSDNASALGPQRKRHIDENGATIGRCPERSDWVIDRAVQSYVSRLHARIVFEDGHFHVIGVGTNPIAVYEPANIVPNAQPYRLRAGDRFFIEEFEIQVVALGESLRADPFAVGDLASWNDDAVPMAAEAMEQHKASSADGALSEPGSFGNILDLIAPEAKGATPVSPGPSIDQEALLADLGMSKQQLPKQQVSPSGAAPQSSPSSQSSRSAQRNAAPAATPLSMQVPEPITTLDDLLRAANITAADLPPGLTDNFGKLLLIVMQGLVDLLQSRSMIKYEGGVAGTRVMPIKNNPLKVFPDAVAALRTLLGEPHPAYLTPEPAITEAIEDLRRHQVVVVNAMRNVFNTLLDRFDPEHLKREFSLHDTSGLLGMREKARFHDLYEEYFSNLRQNSDKLFKQSFAEAYERQERAWKASPQPHAGVAPRASDASSA